MWPRKKKQVRIPGTERIRTEDIWPRKKKQVKFPGTERAGTEAMWPRKKEQVGFPGTERVRPEATWPRKSYKSKKRAAPMATLKSALSLSSFNFSRS